MPDDFSTVAGILKEQYLVPRETIDRLHLYIETLKLWQSRINLVSAETLSQVWERHVLDSIQLASLLPEHSKSILDFGSGAGFPGMVLAICQPRHVTMVERIRKKTTFLSEVARLTGAHASILTDDIYKVTATPDVITARAVSSLINLLDMVEHLITEDTFCLFPKGSNWYKEIEEAQERWHFTWSTTPGRDKTQTVILAIENIKRRE